MKNIIRNIIFMAVLLLGITAKTVKTQAADAVYVRDIDYEKLTMKVYKNGNSIVYFASTLPNSLSNWDEVTGVDNTDGYTLVDISWASSAVETSFYLRGDVNTTAVKVTLPKQSALFKVKFEKASGDFTFTGKESQTYFYYRKSTDYNWKKVMFNTADSTYEEFLKEVENLRFKGSKLVFKLGQSVGCTEANPNNYGERPSKEVTVAITKFAAAPIVKVNITKLNINTRATMEFSDDLTEWKPCTKNMNVEDIASEVIRIGVTPTQPATVYFRVAQTETKPASQVYALNIPAQRPAPTVGITDAADVKYYYEGKYLMMSFLSATNTTPYEYSIYKGDEVFDEHTAKWRTVKSNKLVKLSQKSVENAEIYVRIKGVNANASKKISLVLPSDTTYFVASGFVEPLDTKKAK